ncbi:unnamed protein product [Absidia cylindrospora]
MLVYFLLLASHTDTVENVLLDSSSSNTKPLHSTDDLMNSLLVNPSPSFRSLAQHHSSIDNSSSPMINTPCLDAFSTPFTPSATGFATESPMMTTPYMDPLMASAFSTPMIDASSTPFMGASSSMGDMDQFLTPAMPTDASDLMTPMIQQQQQADDDSLFPPLSNEEKQQQQQQSSTTMENDMDVFFDDLFGAADVFPSNEVRSTTTTTTNNNNKRQRQEDTTTSSITKQAKTSDRQFMCPVCDRGFNRRYNLGTHIKTHNKDRLKPFACDLCPKSFDRKHDCERHVSTVHRGERLFTCHPCAVSFSRRDALHRHQIQKH